MDRSDYLTSHMPTVDIFFTRSSVGDVLSRSAGDAIGNHDAAGLVQRIKRTDPSSPLVPAILSHTSLGWGRAIYAIGDAPLIDLASHHLIAANVDHSQDELQAPKVVKFLQTAAAEHVMRFAGEGIADSIHIARMVPRHNEARAKAAYANPVTRDTITAASSSSAILEGIIPGNPSEPNSIWYNYHANTLETNITTKSERDGPVLRFTPRIFELVANVQLAFPLTHPITS